jgi:hypothetical protein
MFIPGFLYLSFPVLSAWISTSIASPLSYEAISIPTPTQDEPSTTTYWSYESDDDGSTNEPADGLPPVAAVFSAMAHQTTLLLPSPIPFSPSGSPGLVLPEEPTPAAGTHVTNDSEYFRKKIRELEVTRVLLIAIMSIQALIIFLAFLLPVVRGCVEKRKKEGVDAKPDWWKRVGGGGKKALELNDETTLVGEGKEEDILDIGRGTGKEGTVPIIITMHTSSSAPSNSNPHPLPNPNSPPRPLQQPMIARHIRHSSSTPAFHSPSPIVSNPRGTTKTAAEFLASLDLNRNSVASTSSSFTTAESHPHWITHTHPQSPTQTHTQAQARAGAPQGDFHENGVSARQRRKSEESTRSEWDIAKWYSAPKVVVGGGVEEEKEWEERVGAANV